MPFVKSAAKADIKAKLLDLRNNTDDPDAAADELAEAIVSAIADQVKAGVETAIYALSNGAGPVAGTVTFTVT